MAVIQRCVDTAFFGQVCDACDGGSIYKIIAEIIKILTLIIGPLAIIGIIIAGIMYMTASGDSSRQTKAKRRIVDIVIGLGCYAVMFAFANFLIPGGVIKSTLDSTTSSCPVERRPQQKEDEDDDGNDDQGQDQGQDQQDDDNDDGDGDNDGAPDDLLSRVDLTGEKAPYFLSDPVTRCPTNTKHANAEKTIDYTSGEHAGWSFVNTPIDVIKYSEYLLANHISMDGKTCMTNGTCKGGDYYDDGGNCEKFAPVFAGNLNGNTCVSNDAFASHMGRTDKNVFSPSLWIRNSRARGSGNFSDVPRRVNKQLFDPSLNFSADGKSSAVYPGGVTGFSNKCGISKKILEEIVDNGRPVVVRVRGGSGHWAVAVGVKTSVKEAYLVGTGSCGGAPVLSGTELVFLNTDGKIYHDQSKFWSGFNTYENRYRLVLCGSSCN